MPQLPTWSRRVPEEHLISVRFWAAAPHPLSGFGAGTRSVQALLKMKYYVYIVRCRDNSLYTGITTNIERRIKEHNTKRRGAKSIKGKLPVTLVHTETYPTKSDALKREQNIKNLTKLAKEQLVTVAGVSISDK